MEKRIGVIAIVVSDRESVNDINFLLSKNSEIILFRNGMPLKDYGISVITLVVNSNADDINALTGKLGRLKGVKVRLIL